MLQVAGKSWEDMGILRWELVGCLALAWIMIAAALFKGIKSSGKVAYVTATFPFFLLAVLLVRGNFRRKSSDSIKFINIT